MAAAAPVILSRRRFSMDDQLAFAGLSGDANPIHLDPVAARRSVVGAVVVHGVHTVLCLLDSAAAADAVRGFSSLDAYFLKPLYLDEEVSFSLVSSTETKTEFSAQAGQKVVANITLTHAPQMPVSSLAVTAPLLPPGIAQDNAFAELAQKSGTVSFAAGAGDFAKFFPHAAAAFGTDILRALAACSRLVGMDCPGLRSVFSRLSVTTDFAQVDAPLSYRVTGTDERFNLVRMDFIGAGIAGRIEAFAPPPPAAQADMATIAGHVSAHDFAGQAALVVGGSRGLGELTAKIIAAGGGQVVLTYAAGKTDAERVAAQIVAAGGKATIMPYDATADAAAQLQALGDVLPTHLYYFASPRIAQAKARDEDDALLEKFMSFYVRGFEDICTALYARGAKALHAFYPSTVFVEDVPRGLAEYAKAKTAGEALCKALPQKLQGVTVTAPRLPRLPTDQNAAMTPQDLPDALAVILPLIRAS